MPAISPVQGEYLQFFVCGGPSSSLSRAYLAALSDRPRMPSPHSFSALWRTNTSANTWLQEHSAAHLHQAIELSAPYSEFNNMACMASTFIICAWMSAISQIPWEKWKCYSKTYIWWTTILGLICNQHYRKGFPSIYKYLAFQHPI